MVAPGNNLEFEDLPEFERRCRRTPGLREKIIEEIKNRPNRGKTVFGPVKKLEIELENRTYTAYFGRSRNHIGLADVFEKLLDTALQFRYEQDLKERYSDNDAHDRRPS